MAVEGLRSCALRNMDGDFDNSPDVEESPGDTIMSSPSWTRNNSKSRAQEQGSNSEWDDLVEAYHKKRQQNLIQCGFIQDLRVNSVTGSLEESMHSSRKGSTWREVFSKEEQIEQREREHRLMHRVRSDSSFSVTAAMMGGLASRALLTETGEGWPNPTVFAAFATTCALVVSFNMIYIMTCAMVYFNVYRILSMTSATTKTMNDRLLAFWRFSELLRSVSRDLFLSSIPLFMTSISVQASVTMPAPANRIVALCLFCFAITATWISVKSMAYTEVYFCRGALDVCRYVGESSLHCLRAFISKDDEDMESVITPGRAPSQARFAGNSSLLQV